jgi:uncharacterized membrane protein YeiB
MTLRLRKDDVIGAALLAALLIFVLAPLLTVIVWAFADQWRPPALLPTQWGVRYWAMLLARADVVQALTTSLFISLLATFVFYGWGLGRWNRVGPAAETALAIALFVGVQLPLSTLWLRRFRAGPLEALWRRFTYG